MIEERIYLDFAAATPVDHRVMRAMQPYYSERFYNPSAIYREAVAVKKDLDDARTSVARSIGARASEIIFTAGGTESANLAIHGVMQSFPGSRLIVSSIEHDAVRKPAGLYDALQVHVNHKGVIKLDELQKMLQDDVVLISVMLINNEVGSIQPVQEITRLVQDIRKDRKARGVDMPLYVHTDAAQAPLYVDISISKLGVDLMTLNGGKIYGPKQSGILYKHSSVILLPQVTGGGQEWGYRSGTENVAQAIGFALALHLSEQGRSARAKSIAELRDWFMTELEKRLGAQITGDRLHRSANNIHAIFNGIDNERVLFALDELGISVGIGSACSASSDEPSHVLLAMGYTAQDAQSSLRFTIAKETSGEELKHTLQALQKILI